ncbi:MAG TPA: hypothetical protein VF950_14560 [Planctomycetota bacterium]
MIPALLLLALSGVEGLDVFHVSPSGNDANDGRSPARAWKTVAKVNATSFQPGDRILFARGGEWRECLKASSDGAPGKPVTYEAYGSGAKPKFWGSDVVKDGKLATAPAAALVDHVFVPWTWKDGALKVERAGLVTACVRVDLVNSNGKNHLVFRDLVADESADAKDGYGFRVMGSRDVLLENCEAYRAGRHHFGVINSTEFTGKGLRCGWAMPNCPGGATFYVSFSDPSRKGDTHQWIDCAGENFDNPGQRPYQIFYDHGEGLGPILIKNMTSKGGKFSVAGSKEAPVTIQGGLVENNSLEIFGSHLRVEGLVIKGDGAVDHFGTDSVFENLVVDVEPKNGGPTGYGVAFLLREGAKNNAIRFCTLTKALKAVGPGPASVVASIIPKAEGLTLGEHCLSDGQLGPDLRPGPPAIGKVPAPHPATDAAGRPRPKGPCAIGAYEPR